MFTVYCWLLLKYWRITHHFGHMGKRLKINDPHLSIFLKPNMISFMNGCRVDGAVKIEGGNGVTIGVNVHIASTCHINGGGGMVILGDHSGYSSGVKVAGGLPDLAYLYNTPAEPPELCHVIKKVTTIGAYAALFTNCVIQPGVTIGEGAVIMAGAVVTHDVPAWEYWGGCPARFVKTRKVTK